MYDITYTKGNTVRTVHSDKIGVEPRNGGELTYRVPAEGWPGRYFSRSFPLANSELDWTNDGFGTGPGTL